MSNLNNKFRLNFSRYANCDVAALSEKCLLINKHFLVDF